MLAGAVNLFLIILALELLAPGFQRFQASGTSSSVHIIDFMPELQALMPAPLKRPPEHVLPVASLPAVGGAPAGSLALAVPDAEIAPPSIEISLPIPQQAPRMKTTRAPSGLVAPAAERAGVAETDGTSDSNGTGAGTGLGAGHFEGADAGSAPVSMVATYRQPPEYPPEALAARIEGVVTLEFSITSRGTVEDARVIEAVPIGVFEQAALSAITKWRYSPAAIKGPQPSRRARQSMLFSLKR